jgi:hypothetical protein
MVVGSIGVMRALYVFMTDALHVANQGIDVIRATLPAAFNWNIFVVALSLMAAPIVDMVWQRNRAVTLFRSVMGVEVPGTFGK